MRIAAEKPDEVMSLGLGHLRCGRLRHSVHGGLDDRPHRGRFGHRSRRAGHGNGSHGVRGIGTGRAIANAKALRAGLGRLAKCDLRGRPTERRHAHLLRAVLRVQVYASLPHADRRIADSVPATPSAILHLDRIEFVGIVARPLRPHAGHPLGGRQKGAVHDHCGVSARRFAGTHGGSAPSLAAGNDRCARRSRNGVRVTARRGTVHVVGGCRRR